MLSGGVYFRPEWIDERVAALSGWLPLSPLLDGLRAAGEGASPGALAEDASVLVAWFVFGTALARGGFRWNA